MMKSRLLGAVGILAVTCRLVGVLAAQAPEALRFEVASVRVAPPGTYIANVSPYGQNRWTAGCLRLSNLVGMAFDGGHARSGHMDGLPDWNNSECYSVAAKAEDGVFLTREALRPRLQQLLAERFKLVAHVETQAVNGYGLVLAKGGPKLKETTKPQALASVQPGRMRATSTTMDVLALALGSVGLEQPVVNETGLAGNYDFTLTYAPDGATDSTLPSLFTALEEQLGLKLERGRKVPVDTVVIDHVEHPTPD